MVHILCEAVDREGGFCNGLSVDSNPRLSRFARQFSTVLGVGVLLALVLGARCWNLADVFVSGVTFFVDPDCYSRMTRAQMVMEGGGPVRFHAFENWPTGVVSHTTALMDYAIVVLAKLGLGLEKAGAWIAPLLGVAMGLFLWIWSGRVGARYRVPMLLLFAVSPMLVHGTLLGRPDHHALILLCMAAALGAEVALLQKPSKGWGIVAGAAWGLGLWVSLYEPGILFLVTMALLLALNPRGLVARERWAGWGVFVVILVLGLLVEGLPKGALAPEVVQYFPNWSRTIGELAHVPLFSGTMARWTLAFYPLVPLLLWWRARRGDTPICRFWLVLFLVTLGLTCWQARWGYFVSLVMVMALPWTLAALPKRWMALGLFVGGLWPVARDWEERLGWNARGEQEQAMRMERRQENLALRQVAEVLKMQEGKGAFVAPWWQSPALAYWSGMPGVAGSSHQSLPGTVFASRVFLADADAALKALQERGVRWLVVYAPERVAGVSAAILGWEVPGETTMHGLFARPHSAPQGFRLVEGPQNRWPYFRVFEIVPRSGGD